MILLRELPFSSFDFPRWQAVLVVSFIAAGVLSANAYASETQAEAALQPTEPVAAFSDTDLNALFEQEAGKPMQLAALSGQEMKETEGARGLPGAIVGGLWGGGSAIMNQIGQGRRFNQWNWGTIGTAAAFGAAHGATARVGAIAGYLVPRAIFFGSFAAGRMGW